jgi:hypothetical protein
MIERPGSGGAVMEEGYQKSTDQDGEDLEVYSPCNGLCQVVHESLPKLAAFSDGRSDSRGTCGGAGLMHLAN